MISSTQTKARTPVDVEGPLRAVLAPLAHRAAGELVCEILPGVGHPTYGEPGALAETVARLVTKALDAGAEGDIHVRIARQFAGWAPTKTVMVTVLELEPSGETREHAHAELSLPPAVERDGDEGAFVARRVLVAARSHDGEGGVHAVAIDESLTALLRRLREDRALGGPLTLSVVRHGERLATSPNGAALARAAARIVQTAEPACAPAPPASVVRLVRGSR